jgi:phenylacetic acid degradation protein
MDDCVIGEECIIGALAFVPANTTIPRRSVVVGNPAKIIKEVSDEMIDWKTKGTALYQALPKECQEHLRICEPLTEIESDRPQQEKMYETWNKIKG